MSPRRNDDYPYEPYDAEDLYRIEKENLRAMSGKSPQELEDEIVQIRADMDRTLSEIENVFRPAEILERLQDYIAAGPGEFASNLGRTIRDNPVPVLLVAIGVTWLGLSTMKNQALETASRTRAARRVRTKASSNRWREVTDALARMRSKGERGCKKGPRRFTGSLRGRGGGRVLRPVRRPPQTSYRKPLLMSSLGAFLGAALGGAVPNRRRSAAPGSYLAW